MGIIYGSGNGLGKRREVTVKRENEDQTLISIIGVWQLRKPVYLVLEDFFYPREFAVWACVRESMLRFSASLCTFS